MSSVTRVEAQYPNRRALLSSARAEGSELSLFVPTTARTLAGTEVTLQVSIEDSGLRFELQGKVRLQLSGGARTGLGVTFAGEQKRAAAQMLAICAGRALEDGTALDTRHAVNVPCLVTVHGKKLDGVLKDISNTGAFINSPRLASLRSQAELTIQLEPLFGRWGGRSLKGRIVWVGEKRGVFGFGVRFLDTTSHVRESLKKHFPTPAR